MSLQVVHNADIPCERCGRKLPFHLVCMCKEKIYSKEDLLKIVETAEPAKQMGTHPDDESGNRAANVFNIAIATYKQNLLKEIEQTLNKQL